MATPSLVPMLERRAFLRNLGVGLLAVASRPAFAQVRPRAGRPAAARAKDIFNQLDGVARARAAKPAGPRPAVAPELARLSYDHYRQIRYRPARGLWRGEGRPFEVQFFHEGRGFPGVDVFVDDARLPFDPGRFIYPAGIDPARLGKVGYSGLRVHAPFKRADYPDEFLVFLGASYFRAVGREESYGLSARCLAIDLGGKNGEEFPAITALHLVRPDPGDKTLHLVAEVRSGRSEAVFHFEAAPGETTTLEVDAAVYLRGSVEALGLAPLSSMFLFGEEQPGRFGDFRPEVHDSDGLVLVGASGEQIFRPLRNPDRTTVSSFQLDDAKLFGLVQRDRDPASYQDYEARYETRPSAWIEPRGAWGAGALRLLEITTRLESDDNIAMAFVPTTPGSELHVSYRVSFGKEPPSRYAGARVRAVRSGIPGAGFRPVTDGSRLFIVDWDWAGADGAAAKLDALETRVDARGGTVVDVRTEKNGADGSWRTAFQVRPSAPDVELRAFLHAGDRAVSETLAHLWQPGKEVAAR